MALRPLILVVVVGCHSSCDESTGAAPAVVPEAGPVLGAAQPIPSRRPVMMHPIMRLPSPADSTNTD
jgi:hypothetical protein